MAHKDENSPSNLWNRRSKYVKSVCSVRPIEAHATNSSSKVSLSTNRSDREHNEPSSAKRFGTVGSSHGKSSPFNSVGQINTTAVASPSSSGASSAFGLGSGAFASFGGGTSSRTPKTPGSAFDFSKAVTGEKKDDKEERSAAPRKSISSLKQSAEAPSKELRALWPLRHSWVMHYRPPTGKNSDYEKSITPICRIDSAQAFWAVYAHLKRPSSLPIVSDYHIFKEGIRPVWEDDENKKGGKWTMRLKKGVADRYWEELLLAMIGDQFAEASEEVCGAVVSVRSGEDVFSIWTKNDGGRNIKIRETIKRVLSLPADTNLQFKSHDESITQRHAVDVARQEKAANNEKRRNTLNADRDSHKRPDEESKS